MRTNRTNAVSMQRFMGNLGLALRTQGKVDGASMARGLLELGQNADVDQLRSMLSSNRDGQFDPAAREALKNFVLAAQHGEVPDATAVRQFSLRLQSRLVETAAAVKGMNVEIGLGTRAIGRVGETATARDLKAALHAVAGAEAAARAAVEACAAAQRTGAFVLEAYSLTVPSDAAAPVAPPPDVSAHELLVQLESSVATLREAGAIVTTLVEQAMGGTPVAAHELGEAMWALNGALVDATAVHELLRRV